MSPAGKLVIQKALQLAEDCRQSRSLLATTLSSIEAGFYDPLADMHLIRLPGADIRAIRQLLDFDPRTVEEGLC